MRATPTLCLMLLSLVGSGCTLVKTGTDLVCYEMKENLDDHRERARNLEWAEAAWERLRATNPSSAFTEDYGDGFKAGFADYLYAGGSGEPPPLPPRHYRALRYQTPSGYKAVEDWFAGFRTGAVFAHQGGYRQWVTGPSALRHPDPVPPPAAPAVVPVPAPDVEQAPAPRMVPTASRTGRFEPAYRPSQPASAATGPTVEISLVMKP